MELFEGFNNIKVMGANAMRIIFFTTILSFATLNSWGSEDRNHLVNCEKKSIRVEKKICNDKGLLDQDKKVVSIFIEKKDKTLTVSQYKWFQSLEKCKDNKKSEILCLRGKYKSRLKYLLSYKRSIDDIKSVISLKPGKYHTGNVEGIEIALIKGEYFFSIDLTKLVEEYLSAGYSHGPTYGMYFSSKLLVLTGMNKYKLNMDVDNCKIKIVFLGADQFRIDDSFGCGGMNANINGIWSL